MEQKITKIFSYFTDIKHENIFSLCVLQLVEAYDDSPQALKPILYNLKTLFFSKTKQPRLKLKQRQLASSIIEKIISKHTIYLDSFLNRNNVQDMENFHIEEGEQQQPKSQASKYQGILWSQVPFAKIMETKPLLLSSDQKFKQTQEELKKIESQFFEKMNSTETATATNLNIFLGDLAFLQSGETENAEEAISGKLLKYEKKIDKLKNKKEESSFNGQQVITVFNPFNFIYQFGIDNIFSPHWQTRHLSVLLLKALVPSFRYIGFNFSIKVQNVSREESFFIIYQATKKHLESFIKINNSLTIRHEVIYQSMLLLALDRFADYQTERSNIMVRSISAKILATIFETMSEAEKHQLLAAIKSLLMHEPSINDPLGLFAWQLRHSFVFLIFLIIEQPANRQTIFTLFSSTFLTLFENVHEDQVILTLCQCLNLLHQEKFFTTQYAKEINSKLWNIIKNLDDVSYSATKIFSLLGGYLSLIQIDELDCLLRLKNFFTNRIEQVRQQFYKLATLIFSKKFTVSTKQNYTIKNDTPTTSNIIPWIATQFLQQIMIEQYTDNLSALVMLGSSLFPYLLADGEQSLIAEFCSNVVCMFEPIQRIIQTQFVNKSDYKFICLDQKTDVLNDCINIRIWKVSQVIGQMLVTKENYLTENVLDPFISLGTSVDTRFLLISLGIISEAFRKKPEIAIECKFLLPFVESALKYEQSNITTAVLDMFQSQLQNNFKQYLPSITNPQQLLFCQKNLKTKTLQVRAKFHSLLLPKYTSSPTPILHLIISLIQTIAQIQKDLLKNIKLLASYCYCCLIPDQQPKPLNLIIKSIQQCLKQEKYYFISEVTAACMQKLSMILFQKNKSVYTKFNTNTLNQVASKYELKKIGVQRKKGHFKIEATRMQALGKYIRKIVQVEQGWLNSFEGCFLKGFEQEESLNGSLNLIDGTIESLVSVCKEDFFKNLLFNLQKLFQSSVHAEKLGNIIKKTLMMTVLNWRKESGLFLEWIYNLFREKLLVIKVLKQSLEENIALLSPICCLFLLESIKLMTGGGDLREPAMGCLSNLFMGAFISTKKLTFCSKLDEIAEKGDCFVRDFKNINNFEYEIQIKQKLSLRNYQHQGIKWLGFLVKYHLNGALCDDMGLGKTLQTLTVIENQYSKLKQNDRNQISLIVAPPSLIEHWVFEYYKYFQYRNLKICSIFDKYDSNLKSLINGTLDKNMVITSYSVVEGAVEFFKDTKFKFIILDQGHLVKNSKTNKFKALMQLKSDHKFILSGTPVQNKLLELWGIFEFLMPGYLGSETDFKTRYNKLFKVNLMTFKEDDLLFNKEQKDALEALHIKVMPFILRRLKKQVLKELPNKIIQDYMCYMTDIQKKLYQKFNKQKQNEKFDVEQEDNEIENNSALSTLNEMRKIVNHPNLVGNNYQYYASGKFVALKGLLDDLGFEQPQSLTNKIIIFSRFNATLDLIQSLLLNHIYKTVKFSKLVGTVPQNKRFSIAQQFNDSFDIKILLTTTSIGGYGLNLTAANVVIMFDHDYNPSVDMQAIDRAHRLGQKNVLNVYRLVMKDTLEEKIMGIQRFKKNLASAIVNLDNASIKNVEDSKLPDLLEKVSLIQEVEKKKVNKSLYASMIQQMEKDAIEAEDYDVKY